MIFFAVDTYNLTEMNPEGFSFLQFEIEDAETCRITGPSGSRLIRFNSRYTDKIKYTPLHLEPEVEYNLDSSLVNGDERIFIFSSKVKALDFIQKYFDRVWNFYNSQKANAEAKMAEITYLASGY